MRAGLNFPSLIFCVKLVSNIISRSCSYSRQSCRLEAETDVAIKGNLVNSFIMLWVAYVCQTQELSPWSQYHCDTLNPIEWVENSLSEITAFHVVQTDGHIWMMYLPHCVTCKSMLSLMCLNSITFFVVWYKLNGDNDSYPCSKRQTWSSVPCFILIFTMDIISSDLYVARRKLGRQIKLSLDLYMTQWDKIHCPNTSFWTRYEP